MASRSDVRVTWNGALAKRHVRAGIVSGLDSAARVVGDASLRAVPRDTQALARSERESVDEATLTAAISYDTPYAVRRHERLQDRHPVGESSKYLERPLIASRAKVGQAIAKALRSQIGDR